MVLQMSWTLRRGESAARPLDATLVPLRRKLELKTQLYQKPQGCEKKAMMHIENAREAGIKAFVKKAHLENAANELEETPLNEPAGAGEGKEKSSEEALPRIPDLWINRLRLWYAITEFAWASRIASTAKKGADWVIKIASAHAPVACGGPLHDVGVIVAAARLIRAETAVEDTKECVVHTDAHSIKIHGARPRYCNTRNRPRER